MKIRVLIVDDEQLARRNIRRLLSKHDVGSIAECGDGESAVMAIRETKADIVFLDVQMPVMDGFQVIKEVGSQVMPVTVFVTAYDRYALRAFDTNAIDYLLKPVGKDRFERALTRAKERLLNSNPGEIERIISSLERINTIQRYSSRLAIPMKQRIVYVTAKDIDWIQGEGNYVRLHIGKSEYELRETLAG